MSGQTSWDFDVFVGFPGAERAFADRLVQMLRVQHLKVWFDGDQIAAGGPILDTVDRGLEVSRHAVFILTSEATSYSSYEIGFFAGKSSARSAPRRMLGVQRASLPLEKLPPPFRQAKVMTWLDEDDPAERFCELYRGLLGKAPISRAERIVLGHQLLEGSPVALVAESAAEQEANTRSRIRWGGAQAALGCDRAEPWNRITACATTTRSEAIFIVGPRGQGHDLLLDRIEECLPEDARWPRRIHTVSWGEDDPVPAVPSSRELFLEAVARAVGLDAGSQPAELIATLKHLLMEQNVILLHRPVVEEDFERPDLLLYYTQYLPELVSALPSLPFGLKPVQSLAWLSATWAKGVLARLARRLNLRVQSHGGGWVRTCLQSHDATEMLHQIRVQQHPLLPVLVLDPLPDITPDDVRKFCEDHLPPNECGRFVEFVTRGAKSSEEILQRISERLSKKRSV
ncbi:MAG TPA: TIR domain-containing protein [Thermoanaerobaculia bacterium]|nr:TIR domain-containing protein [Thermoanaerobaculia bacterium]